jgi:hypothetical protein
MPAFDQTLCTAYQRLNITQHAAPLPKLLLLLSFSQERQDIVAVWRAVSEDYSPFDVDVTTIPPTVPVTNYVRVIIGGDGAWYGSPGGLSYVGVFGRDNLYYNPVFIFPKMLGPNNPKVGIYLQAPAVEYVTMLTPVVCSLHCVTATAAHIQPCVLCHLQYASQ